MARLVNHARAHFAPFVLVSSLVAFVLWTWLALQTTALAWLDAPSTRPRLTPGSPAAQVWAAISIVTTPVVFAVILLVFSIWSWQRRLRNLAIALLLSVALGWGGNHLLKVLFARPRPPSPLSELITHSGHAYPSGHLAMVTTAAMMVIAATTTTRQSVEVRYLWRVIGALGILLIGYDRYVLNAHWATDIVAGVLVGLVSASLACLVARVHMLPLPVRRAAPLDGARRQRCAVVWNPSKVLDRGSFRRSIEWELERRGWDDALWLQTRPDDPGHEMTRMALEAGVDLVIAAGGDGTVRVVCSELASTSTPMAIIPAGTGNLLARNLGIPLDEVEAARVAFGGQPKQIDLVRVRTDDAACDYFAVMAGIGIDARIMETTRPELKKTVGSAAYFVAAAQEISGPPMELTFRVDDAAPQQRRAMMALVGNVGLLQGGIPLMPRASATDGLLDVIIASPRNVVDWAAMTAKVLARRGQRVPRVDQVQAKRVRISVAEAVPYELDGDTAGHTTVFDAEVAPGALTLMLPR